MMRSIAALIKAVGAKNVYLMGQSYGRLIAQIIAKRHPEAVKGMILSGTCGLGKDIDAEGRAVIDKMLDPAKTAKSHKTKTVLPFFGGTVFDEDGQSKAVLLCRGNHLLSRSP